MEICYRSLDVSHAAGIAELERLCFDDPWSEKMIVDSLSSPYTEGIGAFWQDELVGYIIWLRAWDVFEILNVATHKAYRRRGIGRSLMKLCSGYAVKCKMERVVLEVRQSNEPAISMYRSLGFTEVGVRKNYYKNPPENAVLMDLSISEA